MDTLSSSKTFSVFDLLATPNTLTVLLVERKDCSFIFPAEEVFPYFIQPFLEDLVSVAWLEQNPGLCASAAVVQWFSGVRDEL